MTYAIHVRNGQSVVTVRISPIAAVDKARLLERLDWRVHITNSTGHQFDSRDLIDFCSSPPKLESEPMHCSNWPEVAASFSVSLSS